MGLFKKKNDKKSKEAELDNVFKELDLSTNEIKKQPSRNETRENAKVARDLQLSKDQILQGLVNLRNRMYTNENFDKHTEKLEGLIAKFRRIGDNENKLAMRAVDNLLVNTIREAADYCNRNNKIAMGACMSFLDELINDRERCGDYYTNQQFCKLMALKHKQTIELQTQRSKIIQLNQRLNELMEIAQTDPFSKETAIHDAGLIREEGAEIKEFISALEEDISTLNTAINKIKMIDNSNGTVDLDTIISDVIINGIREIDGRRDTRRKLTGKMKESHQHISSATLGVNDDMLTDNNNTEADFDVFKLL